MDAPAAPAARPKLRFIISDVEMAMAQQLAQFGGILMQLMSDRFKDLRTGLKQSIETDPTASPDLRKRLLALAAPAPPIIPEMGEVFGRALAFITGIDPEKLGMALAGSDVQVMTVKHGTPIGERLVKGEDLPVVLLDPRGRPIGKS